MAVTAHTRMMAKGLVAPAAEVGAPIVFRQPSDISFVEGGQASATIGFSGGSQPYTVAYERLQANGAWYSFPSYTPSSQPFNMTFGSSTVGTQTLRVWATSDGSGVKTYTRTFTVTATPATSSAITEFAGPDDYVYPAAPTAGTYVDGALVVEVNSYSGLVGAIGDNKFIVCEDGTYWGGTTLVVNGRKNLTIMARNRHGVVFGPGSHSSTVNGIHFANCDDLDLIGIDFAKTGYYAIRFGGDNKYYGGSPYGPNRRVRVLGCRFSDLSTGAIKIDNGDGLGTGFSSYISADIEIGWCEVSKIAQAPPSSNIHFSEGIYMGDGTIPYYNRVDDVNIHHCLFDGTLTGSGAGEAIEAKVYCSNIRIADCEIKNWQLSNSTSGGAIALSINSGTNISPYTIPDNGVSGYLVERCRIYGSRIMEGQTPPVYAKAAAMTVGHGNTVIRNNLMWDNDSGGLRFVNNSATHTGIFSNPSQLRVDVYHNTIVGNGSLGQYSFDYLAVPSTDPGSYYARVYSVNNALSGGQNYQTGQGVTWMQQQDAWNVSTGQLVASAFTTTDGADLAPVSDSTLVTGTSVGVTTDIYGNPRPSGQRQFGAIEVQT